MGRILIAYFSRRGANYAGGRIVDLPVGNTEVAAGLLRKLTGGDLFPIEPAEPYPADYTETTEAAQRELRADARPPLAVAPPDLSGCDILFLGYPNWWGTLPMPVWTFLEACDLTGKTVLPFCTHEGSGLGDSERDLKRLCPGATVLKGLPIRGSAVREAEQDLAAWLRRSGVTG